MVKKIALTRGQYALVDDEDFEFLNQWKWYAKYDVYIKGFYALRSQHVGCIDGKRRRKNIRMHRLIMERIIGRALEQKELIDHKNHDPLNNCRENLRIASTRQNGQNMKRKTKSKYPGVDWNPSSKKWRARIQINGKSKHLGVFIDEREAAKAYEKAVREKCNEELICKSNRVAGAK